MTLTQVDDTKIYYEILGDGFPLLMIHGLSEHSHSWDPNLTKGLSKKFKVILFDLPGSGRSELSSKESSIKLFAYQTSRLMNALGISKAHVLGISLGGMIAQELVLNYPEKIEKLILCSTHCGGVEFIPRARALSMETIQHLRADRTKISTEDFIRRSVKALFTREFIENNSDYIEDYIQRKLSVPVSNKGLMRQQQATLNFSTYERLSTIKKPTLILHGKKDVMIPPQNSSILAEAIPNSKLVYLENSGHYLAEEIELVLETIISFLD
jgi:pimeloyl-ACP methyl ester carboxylesterase